MTIISYKYIENFCKTIYLTQFLSFVQDQLRDNSIISCQWYSDHIVQLMFSNGLLAYIQIYPYSGDIEKINFDKYLVGKLSEHVSDGKISYLLENCDFFSLHTKENIFLFRVCGCVCNSLQ